MNGKKRACIKFARSPSGPSPRIMRSTPFSSATGGASPFSPPLPAGSGPTARVNPKRLQREIKKAAPGAGHWHQSPAGHAAPAGAGRPGPQATGPGRTRQRSRTGNTPCAGKSTRNGTKATNYAHLHRAIARCAASAKHPQPGQGSRRGCFCVQAGGTDPPGNRGAVPRRARRFELILN